MKEQWKLAVVLPGSNFKFYEDLFEERVKNFVGILAGDSRPIFVTNVLGYIGSEQEKAEKFREIVRKYAAGRLIFTDGLMLINNSVYISQDLTHPSLEGVREIADNWYAIMKLYFAIK